MSEEENLNDIRNDYAKIISKILKAYNSNEDTQALKRELKIEVWRNRKETQIDDNTTKQDNTNTATIYSYAEGKNKNDYDNYKVVGIIEEKFGEWIEIKNVTSKMETTSRETYSVIKRI